MWSKRSIFLELIFLDFFFFTTAPIPSGDFSSVIFLYRLLSKTTTGKSVSKSTPSSRKIKSISIDEL